LITEIETFRYFSNTHHSLHSFELFGVSIQLVAIQNISFRLPLMLNSIP
jgi:hypothetical protein